MRDATKLVQVLAEGKAEAVAKFLLANSHPQIPNPKSCLVLGCDSILLIDGEIHGKPKDAEEAISRWQKMRGKVGELYTGHALIDTRFDEFDAGNGAIAHSLSSYKSSFCGSYLAPNCSLRRYRRTPRLCRLFCTGR